MVEHSHSSGSPVEGGSQILHKLLVAEHRRALAVVALRRVLVVVLRRVLAAVALQRVLVAVLHKHLAVHHMGPGREVDRKSSQRCN